MAGSLPAMLAAILGQSATGIPKGMEAAEDARQRQQQLDELKAHRDASLGLQERQFAETQAQHERANAPVDLSPYGGSPTQDPRTANAALQWVYRQADQKRQAEKEQAERTRSMEQGRTLADQMERDHAVPDPGAGYGPVQPPKHISGTAQLLRHLGVTPRTESAAFDAVKFREPKEPREPKQPTVGAEIVNTVRALEEAQARGDKATAGVLLARLDKLKQYSLPEGANLVGGGTGQTQAQGPPKTQPLPAGEAATNADLRTADNLLGEIDRGLQPGYIGPVAGRLGALRNVTGIGATSAESTHRARLAEVSNALLRAQSGMAVTPQEYERIKQELPQPTDPPVVFKAKLAAARKLIQDKLANRAAEFDQRGFRGGVPAAPAAPAPAAPQLPAGTKMENGEIVSQSGKYVWRGGQWQPR
ncbi:MAG TPA: hypothetical protein VEA69_14745 [Tepidisphaeraceae bacterium]|nr:hypothetical protein [Tepidisphaeraceae bacterium]